MPCHQPYQRGDVVSLVMPVSCNAGASTSAMVRQKAWPEISLQSCLCSTPDLRSFHMGLALFNLAALQNPLRGLKRLLAPPARSKAAADTSAAPLCHQRPPVTQEPRPLRGNWPFTVRPPLRPAETPTRRPAPSGRSFLPMAIPTGSHRPAFLSARPTDSSASSLRSPKVLRRVSDPGTGRLVIAGRMADVCAELDRMAASEAIRA